MYMHRKLVVMNAMNVKLEGCGDLFFLDSYIFLSHTILEQAYPCTGNDPIGQTRLIWRTTETGETEDGLTDDEYYIKVIQNGVQLYSSSQQFAAGSGTTGLMGIAGLGGYQVCRLIKERKSISLLI